MPWWGTLLLVALVVAVAATVWAVSRMAGKLADMDARRGEPDQAMLLLQREVEAARNEGQKGLAETAATVRQELAQFSAQMTAQMGQVGASVQQQLQHVGRVVGDVQGSLGKMGEANQRIFDVGRSIAGLEQILKSPKVRGGLGETFLENMLAQMFSQEHYALQHQFSTGDRVDAVVRIGDRLVPVATDNVFRETIDFGYTLARLP